MRIGVSSVKADALQGRGDESEVALVREFYSEQVGVARILGLCESSIYIALIFVVGADLVYDEIIDFLVEDTGTDQTDAAEIIVAEYLGRDSVWVNEPRTLKSSFTFHFTSSEGRKLM